MKKNVLILIIISILSSCEYDYDMGGYFEKEFTPQVILNSIINPDSLIRGDVFWSRSVKEEGSFAPFKKVSDFEVKLYEDDHIVFNGKCKNGEIIIDIYPKEGSDYKIELNVPNYGIVSASTTIPTTSTFKSSYDEDKSGTGSFYDNTYKYYTIEDVITSQQSRALWIKAEVEFDVVSQEGLKIRKSPYFYMNNTFCDQINVLNDDMQNDGTNVMARGSLEYHYHFIRIPYKNILNALPLKFSTKSLFGEWQNVFIGEDNSGYPIFEKRYVATTNLLVITPSDDYDRYYKSAYKQKYYAHGNDLIIFEEAINVYSNIDNGVGIFAGYVSEKHRHKKETSENNQ